MRGDAVIGRITRWGAKGFGFIEAEGLSTDAWIHANFLDDESYQPQRGDRVSFEPFYLPDGRVQARHVRPIEARPSPSPPPSRVAPVAPATLATLGERLAASGSLGALSIPATTAPAEAVTGIGSQVALRRRDRMEERRRTEQQVASLRGEREGLLRRAEELTTQLERLEQELGARRVTELGEDEALVTGYLAKVRQTFDHAVEEHLRRRQEVERARAAACERVGVAQVGEYDGVRERLSQANEQRDELARGAYVLLERDRRAALRDYAVARDALDAAPPVRARFVAFQGEDAMTLVAPLPADGDFAAESVAMRVACAFWQAAERAATELGEQCVVEDGTVAGLLAVRLPFQPDAALLEVLLAETISRRPSLEALGVEPEFELADGVRPSFVAAEPGELEAAAAGGESDGTTLPEVAVRLGLSLRDLVAVLHEHGLPFVDDAVDAGEEETLRLLLGGAPALDAEALDERPPAESAREPGADPSGDPATEGLSGHLDIASRLLGKLLRDRRVGGRHTRLDNACGHHFSDGEKPIARRIAEWMEKDGIFIPKNNEGSHHISINPRRLRDVSAIIDGTWPRRDELERV